MKGYIPINDNPPDDDDGLDDAVYYELENMSEDKRLSHQACYMTYCANRGIDPTADGLEEWIENAVTEEILSRKP